MNAKWLRPGRERDINLGDCSNPFNSCTKSEQKWLTFFLNHQEANDEKRALRMPSAGADTERALFTDSESTPLRKGCEHRCTGSPAAPTALWLRPRTCVSRDRGRPADDEASGFSTPRSGDEFGDGIPKFNYNPIVPHQCGNPEHQETARLRRSMVCVRTVSRNRHRTAGNGWG